MKNGPKEDKTRNRQSDNILVAVEKKKKENDRINKQCLKIKNKKKKQTNRTYWFTSCREIIGQFWFLAWVHRWKMLLSIVRKG